MSKIINQPVLVITDKNTRPCKFFWGKKWFNVTRIMDAWTEAGRWWEGEPEKAIYRVVSGSNTVAEIEFRASAGQWVLYKVYD